MIRKRLRCSAASFADLGNSTDEIHFLKSRSDGFRNARP